MLYFDLLSKIFQKSDFTVKLTPSIYNNLEFFDQMFPYLFHVNIILTNITMTIVLL